MDVIACLIITYVNNDSQNPDVLTVNQVMVVTVKLSK
jgi:hypothetical protein